MNKMRPYFLFIDECLDEDMNLSALTGIFVPIDKYILVRDAICKIAFKIQLPKGNVIPPLIELHARDLLSELPDDHPNKTDKARISILTDIVDIINSYKLITLRLTYLNHREIVKFLKDDPKLYQTIFSDIIDLLHKFWSDSLIIPVIDGIPSSKQSTKKSPSLDTQLISSFARQIRYIHHMRCNKVVEKGSHLSGYINIAEPVFADSYYSTLIQLVDLVSYLLHQIEKADLNPNKIMSDYQKKVFYCGRSIDPNNLLTRKGELVIS
jgi:hypothetical protein